jgi:hypothetical protein
LQNRSDDQQREIQNGKDNLDCQPQALGDERASRGGKLPHHSFTLLCTAPLRRWRR